MKKPNNIVIYYPSFEKGGATINLVNFANEAVKKNINISLISNIDNKNKKKFFSSKIKLHRVSSLNNSFLTKRFTSSLSSIFILISVLMSTKKNTMFLSFQTHIIPLIFCSIFRKHIVIRNSEDAIDATKYADNLFTAYIVLFLKSFFYFFSNGIITNSIKSKNSLKKVTFNMKNINLIYNPYLPKILKFKKRKRQNVILSVGRFCKQKNQSLIIKAFKIFLESHKDFKLILVGRGGDKNKLKNLVINLNLQNQVIFKDWQTNVGKYYLTSKLLVFPSLYEGLPNTLIDALNYSLPSLTTKCSGAEDILSKKYQFFIQSSNAKNLSRKISSTIKNYNQILISTRNAHKKLNRFLISKQVSKYLNFLTFISNK